MKTCYHTKLGGYQAAIADLCDYYGQGLILTRINVPKDFRNQGHGGRLLDEICAEADKDHIWLYLEISPSGGLDYDQLQTWYESRGFRQRMGIFTRPPGVFEKILEGMNK